MNDKKYHQYKKQYDLIVDEINNELENLKYLLDTVEIDNINLISIHYKIKDLIFKKNRLKDLIYDEFDELIIDEI